MNALLSDAKWTPHLIKMIVREALPPQKKINFTGMFIRITPYTQRMNNLNLIFL